MSQILREYVQHLINVRLLKEYVQQILLEQEVESVKTLSDLVKFLSQAKHSEIKRSRKQPNVIGVSFFGSLEDLKNKMQNIGSYSSTINPGEPGSLSSKYDSHVFKLNNPIVHRNQTLTEVVISTIDYSTKNILEIGQSLGFGAEHAVYAAIRGPGYSNEEMIENIKKDTRLAKRIETSKNPQEFFEKCIQMRNAVEQQVKLITENWTVQQKPPSGGTDEYDIIAFNSQGERYNVHVKYQSRRVVGLPLPEKSSPGEKIEVDVEDAVEGHPNAIFRSVRDKFVEEKTAEIEAAQQTIKGSEIVAIMRSDSLRQEFYDRLEAKGFSKAVNTAVKKQLGFETKGEPASSLFINFDSPTQVKYSEFTPAKSSKFDLIIKPTEPTAGDKGKPGVSPGKAYTFSAVFNDGTTIDDIFRLEFSSIARGRGLDLHKGLNFEKFDEKITTI